jgi:magnesium-transporting ATPase (P-type)
VPRQEPLLTRVMYARIALMSITITVVTLGTYIAHRAAGFSAAHTQTATFTVLAVCEWFNVLSCRSATRSGLTLGVLQNRWLVAGLVIGNLLHAAVIYLPPLRSVFHTVRLPLWEVLALGAAGSLVLWVEELRKLLLRRRLRRGPRYFSPSALMHTTAPLA